MAESVVLFAVEKIGKLLIDEAKFLWRVEGKVKDLKNELNLIQCLLRDADRKQEHDQAARECVAQLRDIAYDAEDVIERYILRVAPKKGQNIIQAFACFGAKCTGVLAHEVGIEIVDLKSSISNLGTRMRDYGIQPLKEGERKCVGASTRKRTYAHFEEDFVGREDSIEELVRELKDGNYRVVSLWGMGGLGKTTLARKVFMIFDRDEVKNHFDRCAWTCVSQEYNMENILVEILVQLMPDQGKKIKEMIVHELLKTLYKIQQEKRCLVVLDDIWTQEAWKDFRTAFPVTDTTSKLLITTRNQEIAKYIDPHCFLHKPHWLSLEESWVLLKKRAFLETKAIELSSVELGVGQGIVASQVVEGIARQSKMEGHIPEITEHMQKLGDELLEKCGGLPLAIIVLGGLLAHNEWERVYRHISLHFSDKSELSKEVLALSYDDLPWRLKPCFLYLGSFPEDAEILMKRVLQMWIAEGFLQPNADDEETGITMEDVAEQYLMELVNRGLVQAQLNLNGDIKTCRLHDLMRDLCVSKAKQEKFLSFHNIQHDNEREGNSSSMAREDETTCKTRRLSLTVNVSGEGNATLGVEQIGRTMPQVRTLLFFQSRGSFERISEQLRISEQFQPIFINCKFLRVLKLENIYFMGDKLSNLGKLIHLRFLSLRYSIFSDLSQSMGNLVCMEFLDLRTNKDIRVSMPNVLWKMRRLRYLSLPYDFDVKEKFHEARKKLRLGTLKNLRTLRNFNPNKCDVNDVGKLTNLQKLNVSDWDYPIELEIFPQLAEFNLEHLRSSSFYLVNLYNLWTEDKLSKMSNYPYSCKLSIFGKIEKLPEHKSLPQELRKLVLLCSKLEEDPMPILEKLPHLVFLMLGRAAFVGKEMVCSAGGFPQLKRLHFHRLEYLEEWRAAEGAVPHLSRLGILWCPKLRVVPSHVSTYYCDEIYEESRKFNIIM